jgi:hypothetical protein
MAIAKAKAGEGSRPTRAPHALLVVHGRRTLTLGLQQTGRLRSGPDARLLT